DLLNFCANNYLGLANNTEIIKAAKNALDEYGAGLSSVRFICGTQTIHKQLEQAIAKFHKREDAILYISCFDANAGIFETLLKEQDYIISGSLSLPKPNAIRRLWTEDSYRFISSEICHLA
ncbi:unnamed protein product, partial [Rotaria magnacalcarata]